MKKFLVRLYDGTHGVVESETGTLTGLTVRVDEGLPTERLGTVQRVIWEMHDPDKKSDLQSAIDEIKAVRERRNEEDKNNEDP